MQQQLHLTNCTSSTNSGKAYMVEHYNSSHSQPRYVQYCQCLLMCWWSSFFCCLIVLRGADASQPAPEGHSRGREGGSLERGGAGGGGANAALATAGQQGAAERGGRHAHMVSQHKLPPQCLLFVSATQCHPAPLHAMHQRSCKDMAERLQVNDAPAGRPHTHSREHQSSHY
jgi:hypothetical protein